MSLAISFFEHEMKDAQRQKTYTIKGRTYKRKSIVHTCEECGARDGQFHIPGCKLELCPACYGQAITCDCVFAIPDDD